MTMADQNKQASSPFREADRWTLLEMRARSTQGNLRHGQQLRADAAFWARISEDMEKEIREASERISRAADVSTTRLMGTINSLEKSMKESSVSSERLAQRTYWLTWVIGAATVASSIWGSAMALRAWFPA